MNRSLAKLAAALLLGSALASCSTFDSAHKANSASDKSASAARPNTSAKSMEAGMDVQIREAVALRGKGDYAGATQILSQLMLVAPDNSRVVGEYGKNLVQQGRSKEALDFLKRAVQLQPSDWTLYSATGVSYDQSGDYANAKIAYQQALSIKPGDVGVLNNYALSRMQANDLAGARQLMAQASAAGSSDPKIAQNVALLASLGSTQVAPAAAKTAATQETAARPIATHPVTAKTLGPSVIMQQIPKDALAGPVKHATGAPRKLAQDVPEAKKPATAAPHKTAEPSAAKKKPAADKTPSLRMTADAATP